VTLIQGGADHGLVTNTDAALTRVRLGAGIGIVTSRSVCHLGIRTLTCTRIADTHLVTLIEGYANNRVGTDADAALAGVRLGAPIAVIAQRPVRQFRI